MDLITSRILLKSVQPDIAKTIACKYGLDEDTVEVIRKGIVVGNDLNFDEGEKASIDYITTGQVDRDGEIIDPSGILLEEYSKHPVVMWCHDYKSLPLGRAAWVKTNGDGLIAKTIYAVNANPFAKQVYEYRRDGFPMAKSIGIVPLQVQNFKPTKENGGLKRKYGKSLMLEYSDTPIPSNPGALQIAVSKGITTMDEIKKMWPGFAFDEIDLDSIELTTKDYDPKAEYEAVCKALQERYSLVCTELERRRYSDQPTV